MRLLTVLAMLLISVSASAATAAPSTPAGTMLQRWLAAFNSNDQAQVEAFRSRHGGQESVEEMMGYRDFSGGLELVRVDARTPTALTATLRERDAGLAEVVLELSLHPEQPERIDSLTVVPQPVVRLALADALAGLSARADNLAEADDYSGAFLIARDGEVLMARALGDAERTADIPNTLDTRFRYGSLGKMFTAVAVLQLVESGKLSLESTVGDHLPDYPQAEVARTVTVRHLLTHTSGVSEIGFWDSEEFATPAEFLAYRDSMKTHSDYVARYGARKPIFAPGSRMEYSNYGFILLGRLIEEASGRSYYDYVDQEILARAGMDATGAEPESTGVALRAAGYRRNGADWVSNADLLPYRGMAAGGGYTTVGDMLNFALALQSGRLLSMATLSEATRPQNDEGWYGYGFLTVGRGALRRYGHSGDFPGMNADFRVFPESGYVLIALSNLDPPAAYRLFRYFEPRMPLER